VLEEKRDQSGLLLDEDMFEVFIILRIIYIQYDTYFTMESMNFGYMAQLKTIVFVHGIGGN
jgi:hypothetical protein